MAALRAHPLFDGIVWDRLWTDPVPPLEAGLIKRASLEIDTELQQYDTSAEWADLGDAEAVADDIEEYEPGPLPIGPNPQEHAFASYSVDSPTPTPASITHERPDEHIPVFASPFPASPIETIVASPGNSPPSSPPSSRLTGFFDTLSLAARTRRSSSTSSTSTVLADSGKWMRLLRPSEVPVFSSCVLKAPRRSFSRHFLAAKPRENKSKVRLLVLTKTRLLCLKENDGDVVLNNEVLIGGQGSENSNGVVTGVERVDEGFVVQTVSACICQDMIVINYFFLQASKSYTYVTEDSTLATRWTKEISDALPVKVHSDSNPIMPRRHQRSRTSST